jgi:hypothetical protein
MRKSPVKKNRVFILSALLTMLFLCAAVLPAGAVMPPDHYRRMAEESKIKAIAVVKSVKVIKRTKRSTHKRVEFELTHPFSPDVPETFTGTCYSVDHAWQDPGVGGTIYYYPIKGTAVFVTITADGGTITGMVSLNEKAEKQFIAHPEQIRYGIGGPYLEEKDENADR